MPGTNARRHKIPLGTELSVTRATIFNEFGESISDVVGVANTTDRGSLVADLTAAGEPPSTTRPLVVLRADARGLHRMEYTTDGAIWIPTSGVLTFADKAAADAWGTANPGLLSVNDRATAGGVTYYWSGSDWNRDTAWANLTLVNSWVNFGGAYSTARYRRIAGIVYVTGVIKSGTTSGGTNIATLPAGFRPDAQVLKSVTSAAGAASVDVLPNGQINIGTGASGTFTTIELSFVAA